jgi:hypothetical protein
VRLLGDAATGSHAAKIRPEAGGAAAMVLPGSVLPDPRLQDPPVCAAAPVV